MGSSSNSSFSLEQKILHPQDPLTSGKPRGDEVLSASIMPSGNEPTVLKHR